MQRPVLVTGATGTVGRGVVSRLADLGVVVRATTRRPVDPARYDDRGTVERVEFDFGDPTSHASAFAGVDTMFLLRPPQLARLEDLTPALRVGTKFGLRHVVFLSVQGADRIPVLPHARMERWLRSSGLAWTFLRPSFFDQNLTEVHGAAIRRTSRLDVPAGRGRTAFVDAGDVAEVAALILADPWPHIGRAYTLTGSESLTYFEVAEIMSTETGQLVRYTQPGLLRYLLTNLSAPPADRLTPGLLAATSLIYTTARLGLAGRLTGDLEQVLHRQPTLMAEFLAREHAHLSNTERRSEPDSTSWCLHPAAHGTCWRSSGRIVLVETVRRCGVGGRA